MMMRKKSFFLFLCILLTALFITGCNRSSLAPESKTDGKVYDKPLTIDNYGRTITFNQKPQKILTLGPNCTELFVALGLADYVIGNSLNNHSRGPLPEYAEEYNKIPELNYGSATREAVIASGADFIYGIDWQFGGDNLDIEELETLANNTTVTRATTQEEIIKHIDHIGNICAIEDNAKKFVAEQKARIQAVQEKIRGKEPVKVLVYDSGGDGVFTAGGTNFETLLIELAGGKNIFDDIRDKQWTTVSYEEILKRKPDIILIHDYDVPSLDQKVKDIKNDPVLSKLECVQKERFAYITLESVLPGNRMAYTVEKLAESFYPELF